MQRLAIFQASSAGGCKEVGQCIYIFTVTAYAARVRPFSTFVISHPAQTTYPREQSRLLSNMLGLGRRVYSPRVACALHRETHLRKMQPVKISQKTN